MATLSLMLTCGRGFLRSRPPRAPGLPGEGPFPPTTVPLPTLPSRRDSQGVMVSPVLLLLCFPDPPLESRLWSEAAPTWGDRSEGLPLVSPQDARD